MASLWETLRVFQGLLNQQGQIVPHAANRTTICMVPLCAVNTH
jgi:hypothetical protein